MILIVGLLNTQDVTGNTPGIMPTGRARAKSAVHTVARDGLESLGGLGNLLELTHRCRCAPGPMYAAS